MNQQPPQQLSMFRKKPKRGGQIASAIEFRVHCMIADTLTLSLAPGWWWCHYPAGEYRAKSTAGRLKRMGVKVGVSDFLLFGPGAVLHALELKRRGLIPSKAQMDFLARVRDAGGKSSWVDNYDDAVEVLKSWGAVRVTLS